MLRLACLVAALLALSDPLAAYSSYPPTDHVGIDWPVQPPAQRTCRSCHGGFAGPGTTALGGLPAAYTPGQVYSLVLELLEPGAPAYGFELAAIDGAFAPAGSLIRTDATGTDLLRDPTRGLDFLLHTASGTLPNVPGGREWSFDWTAPGPGTGAVTFYWCGNAADGDGTAFGDHVYCATAVVDVATCDPPLGPILALRGARRDPDLAWSWQPDPLAALGYRLYAVARKDEIPRANAVTAGALRDCPAPLPADAGCIEAGAALDPGPWFYQLVGVCAQGVEGP